MVNLLDIQVLPHNIANKAIPHTRAWPSRLARCCTSSRAKRAQMLVFCYDCISARRGLFRERVQTPLNAAKSETACVSEWWSQYCVCCLVCVCAYVLLKCVWLCALWDLLLIVVYNVQRHEAQSHGSYGRNVSSIAVVINVGELSREYAVWWGMAWECAGTVMRIREFWFKIVFVLGNAICFVWE